ncbi:pyrroline-5-carboxylate reductase [Fulvivirga sediminis]|uniref:Pyrroline-5-carboxylate reductase n=1 Tax=Fulvivirga sediminis TaxID=2803949 RepID=A0A937F7Z5_9BACT|nr:pyrroline-5-carboxylate reductase [Fulvivirga sediminis]MBL3658127.1 pyrroline-5-carboxylate reductase [Fulvivirga sediminis]
MQKQSIAILGAGNLGLAIYKGLETGGLLENNQAILTRRDTNAIKNVSHPATTITSDNRKAVEDADIIIFAVQPKQLKDVIDEVKPAIHQDKHTLISVITAVSTEEIEEMIGFDLPIIRAMPNTAIAVGQSMTCIACNKAGKSKLDAVQTIFNCVGKTMVIEENLMQAATVVCASGIAFWMRFIRATTQGGVQLGFDAEDAQKIAVQACLGAASLLNNSESHPEQEIDKVTTPQGCTIAGLNEMEHNGLSSALIKGLVTSYDRINKMKKS